MTTFDVIDLLRRTILLLTPVGDAIFLYPNAPRPADIHYAAISISTMTQVGHGESKDSNALSGDLDRSFSTLFDVKIGVDFFRADAMYSAALLSGGLVTQQIVELWNSEGIGLVNRSSPRDLSKIMNSSFEDRAQLDITMQAEISPPDAVVLGVDAVRVTGEVYNSVEKIEDVHIGPPF